MGVTYFCVQIINIDFNLLQKQTKGSMHQKPNLWQLELNPGLGLPWRMESRLMWKLLCANIPGFTRLQVYDYLFVLQEGKSY